MNKDDLLHDLVTVRSTWYDAFYTRNIELLDYLEVDWFLSTNGQKMIYKKHQLRKLSFNSISDDGYRMTVRDEKEVEIHEYDNIASVSGKATVTDPDGRAINIDFIECWIKQKSGWKLQFQSFDNP